MKKVSGIQILTSGLAAALLIAACGGSTAIDNVDSFATSVKWGDCTGKDAPDEPFECATVSVPADYRNADGDTLKIRMVRLPATEGKAKGIVLTNPGGPGQSGFELVQYAGRELVQSLGLSEFDVIGFDPRGVDRSGGLRCMTDKELDTYLYVDTTPDTPEEEKIDQQSEKFSDACGNKYGESLRNYSTEYTARDMDIIRASMGFEKIHYLGISYGTYLGGVYATLFPDRVASMVLDSAYDPQGDTLEQRYTTQAVGFEKAFANWIRWCENEKNSCPFSSDDVKKSWLDLYDQLDKESLVVDGRDVNHRVLNDATKSALYAERMWPELGRALGAAVNGDGAPLLAMADNDNGRSMDGKYSSQNDSFYAIQCASGMDRELPPDPAALVKKLKSVAPWYYRELEPEDFEEPWCEDIFGTPELVSINYTGDAPVVVVGGKNDPATPFRWAEEMTQNMGANARLVAFSGEGHSQILVSSCVDEIAGAVITELKLPKKGTVCKPDVPLAAPTWWKTTVTAPGTQLDSSVMNSYFGVKPTKTYAQYFAVEGSVATVFRSISASLRAKGLQYDESESADPTKDGQWFYDGNSVDKAIGVIMSDVKELTDNGMVQPKGIVPVGHVVVAIYYFP